MTRFGNALNRPAIGAFGFERLEERALLSLDTGLDIPLDVLDVENVEIRSTLSRDESYDTNPIRSDEHVLTREPRTAGLNAPIYTFSIHTSVEALNDAPVVVDPIDDFAVDENAPDTVIDLSTVFDDVDIIANGDSLTFSVIAPTTIDVLAGRVDESSYTSIHQDLLYTHTGDNRGIYGTEHDLARDNIYDYFDNLGLNPVLDPFSYSSNTYYNVVGTKLGAINPDNIYIVGAHYDSVNNPGADDNASGTAGVMEAARVLSEYTFDSTILFIAFDREEQGLIGSSAFASAAKTNGENVLGMLNLDMIAYNPAGANEDKVRLYDYVAGGVIKDDMADAVNQYGRGITPVDTGQNGYSDHRPFEQQGFDAGMFIEYEVSNNPYYHKATDAVETANYIDYQFATSITAASVGYLATAAGLVGTSELLTATVLGNNLILDYAVDQIGTADVLVRATDTTALFVEDEFTVTVNASQGIVHARHVFYNNSAFDGDTPGADAADDNAIDTSKQVLLPGETATFANYTSYSRGINGLMIDITGLGGTPSASDFIFKVGNENSPANWVNAPAPQSITVRPGAGANGSDRITLIWADNDWSTSALEPGSIAKQWLEVSVLATSTTGLGQNDVFYIGNAVGDTGNSSTDTIVNATDEIGARSNPHYFLDPALVDDIYDFNHDERVNATDEIIARSNQTYFLTDLELITPPIPTAKSLFEPLAKPSVKPSAKPSAKPITESPQWIPSEAPKRSARSPGAASIFHRVSVGEASSHRPIFRDAATWWYSQIETSSQEQQGSLIAPPTPSKAFDEILKKFW